MNETDYHQRIYDAAKQVVLWYGLERDHPDHEAWLNEMEDYMVLLRHALEGKE